MSADDEDTRGPIPAALNPYTTPQAPIAGPAGRDLEGSALRARFLRLALALGAAFGFVVGGVQTFQSAFGLERFGGLEYVPRVVALSLVRGAARRLR